MTTVKFVPKPGKPHIKLAGTISYGFHLWHYINTYGVLGCMYIHNVTLAQDYVLRVNDGQYHTPGEAARALFNYRGEDK